MSQAADPIKVLLYSDDRAVRQQVRLALGSKVASDLPAITLEEVATPAALLRALDISTDYGLVILDGEARPHGGFGLAHQVKEEYADCPPVLLLMAREADAWLGTWSRAEQLAAHPVDPIKLPAQVAEVLRARVGAA